MKNKDIIVIFSRNGLALDTEEVNGKGYYSEKLLADYKSDPYKALFSFGFEESSPEMSVSLSFLHNICTGFVNAISRDPDVEITKTAPLPEEGLLLDFVYSIPFAVGMEYINSRWLEDLWAKLSAAFTDELKVWDGSVGEFLHSRSNKLNVAGRVFFHLVENKSDEYPFAFLATYSTIGEDDKTAVHLPLKAALQEYKDRQDLLLQLLGTISCASDVSEFISELTESGELFSPLHFDAIEAYTFLKEIPLYEECGIMCRMPDWWKKKNSRFRMSVSIGGTEPSKLGLEALVSCEPKLKFDGEEISLEELEALMAQAAGLAYFKGKWIEVDHSRLQSALDAYARAEKVQGMTLAEAMRMELGLADGGFISADDSVEITSGEWLKSLRSKLINPVDVADLSPGDQFKATLRHYQRSGFGWLAMMKTVGFGALLADDMGLGKTVQILALLEYLRRNGGFRCLLIIPASLIGNWQKEIERFAPKISYSVLHAKNVDNSEADLFITTYGMISRLEWLAESKWDLIILDEAQAIKNPTTAQTKSAKGLNGTFRVAMTGTPVENRLGDLWSLFDFLNPGLLGTAKEFGNYAKKLKETGSYTKLRNVVSPFILRRLKTDKSIINDLPEKVEIKEYTTLTSRQAVLYRGLVSELEQKLRTADGIARKGAVLAAIIKFKQICNHPDQYLGQKSFKAAQSGKFETLAEICGTIYEKRERVLVFTQFREMAEPLAEFLSGVFGRGGLVLHGGTAIKKRTELVERFNGAAYVPFMVLSLKAGGVGLNLTAANQVIHFDRWWNPAVENQATDRAFRIGQTKNVMVHKFITAGTLEERIDEMIESKKRLSEDIISSSGENWITEMSNSELMELLTLKA